MTPTAAAFHCTKDTPWHPGERTPVKHEGCYEIAERDGYPGGDIVTMRCPNCGHEWEAELPQ